MTPDDLEQIQSLPWSRSVAEAINEQPEDVRAWLLLSIEKHGLEFELQDNDQVVFKTGGQSFCAVTLEMKLLAPEDGAQH